MGHLLSLEDHRIKESKKKGRVFELSAQRIAYIQEDYDLKSHSHL